ncbi:DUF3784 domain-containing protein [Flavobacterium sp.]|uniref:DUF3784 domain-containing protein n=1 Tax=Flavobacterium sp. TaxID=239 RepID=UPI002B4AF28A|nr:DUF3784 domain-containing protein [Flavobacterium sp.]HLF51034.1 DUF3784 domain-containing protein [Flavobacterium sp.]
MIVPILILSAIFFAIAFIVNENNAKYLLSGYNTMSEVERQNFDIKSYIPFFRNFHFFLGFSLLIISILLLYFVNSDWSGIFLGTYPILAYVYFIWKSNQFAKNKSKKQNITTYIAMSVMFLLFVVIIYEFKSGLKDNEIIVDNKKIEITGEYGTEINISDLKSIELLDKLPEISSKTNGFALETIKKGFFRTVNDEKVKLLINSKKTPIILLITNDNQKIYYSSKDKSNEEIYNEVKREIIKQ